MSILVQRHDLAALIRLGCLVKLAAAQLDTGSLPHPHSANYAALDSAAVQRRRCAIANRQTGRAPLAYHDADLRYKPRA